MAQSVQRHIFHVQNKPSTTIQLHFLSLISSKCWLTSTISNKRRTWTITLYRSIVDYDHHFINRNSLPSLYNTVIQYTNSILERAPITCSRTNKYEFNSPKKT